MVIIFYISPHIGFHDEINHKSRRKQYLYDISILDFEQMFLITY